MEAITGIEGSFEQFIADKASLMRIPIGANLELIPVCNMDCRMCYVRTDMKEVNRLGGLPDVDMWLRLGREMQEMGTLFVLLTGGEPLIYPHFKEVYRFYHELGFILTVNTNGTLLNEEWADFFSEYPPRRMNITIYGQDNETYERLCGNPKGFDQLRRGVELLKAHNIPIRFSCSLTKYNYAQWDRLREIVREWNSPMVTAYYMMPPGRKISNSEELTQSDSHSLQLRVQHSESRLGAEVAAQAAWKILTEKMDEDRKKSYVQEKLEAVEQFSPDKVYSPGYLCRAGSSSFWVKWDGSLTACGMMGDKEFNIQKESFKELWEKLKVRTRNTCLSEKCTQCRLQSLCPHCAAAEYTENGVFGKEPEYLCHFANALYEIFKEKQKEMEE